MKCPKLLRWLCGHRGQRHAVRAVTENLNAERRKSEADTDRMRRESIRSVLSSERSRGDPIADSLRGLYRAQAKRNDPG